MIIRAAWVCPVAAEPIRDGWVAVERDRIVDFGAWPPGSSPRAAADVHLADCILTPGFVNPHTHLELTCYAGRIAPAPFWPWVATLLALRREPGQAQREHDAAIDGAWRSLGAGVTSVGDISRLNVAWRALKPVPIRKVCFVELLTIADQPPRTLDELKAAVEAVEEDALLTVGVSPHASYSVPLREAMEAVAYAARIARPWTMHLAELPEEMDFLAGRAHATPAAIRELMIRGGVESPRIRPGEYARRLADAGGRGSIAHGNYLDSADTRHMASSGVTTIYCPGAHAFFGHPPHPLRQLSEAGAPIAIGTDSLASHVGDRLSILDEIRRARRTTGLSLSAGDWLRLGTAGGAEVLGLTEVTGTIERGKAADLAAFRIDRAAGSAPITDPVSALLDEDGPTDAAWVMVGGCIVRINER
ncbi:MAG: cytosine deaminase [Planctomycetota bacterium]